MSASVAAKTQALKERASTLNATVTDRQGFVYQVRLVLDLPPSATVDTANAAPGQANVSYSVTGTWTITNKTDGHNLLAGSSAPVEVAFGVKAGDPACNLRTEATFWDQIVTGDQGGVCIGPGNSGPGFDRQLVPGDSTTAPLSMNGKYTLAEADANALAAAVRSPATWLLLDPNAYLPNAGATDVGSTPICQLKAIFDSTAAIC